MAIGSGGWRRLLRVWDRARVRRAGRETRGRGVSRVGDGPASEATGG
jgi:hypothetical protein